MEKNMNISFVEVNQLRSELQLQFGEIKSELAELKQARLKVENRKHVTTQEACELLGVSRSSINRYVRNGYLPLKKIGGKNAFEKEAVLKLVQNVNQ